MRLWAEQDKGEYKLQTDGSLQVLNTIPKSHFSALVGALLRYHAPLLVHNHKPHFTYPLFTWARTKILFTLPNVTTDSMQLKAAHTKLCTHVTRRPCYSLKLTVINVNRESTYQIMSPRVDWRPKITGELMFTLRHHALDH